LLHYRFTENLPPYYIAAWDGKNGKVYFVRLALFYLADPKTT